MNGTGTYLFVCKIMRRQSEATHFIHRVACASIRVDSTVIYRNTGSPGCQQVRVRCGVWDSETYHCQRSPCQVKVIDSTKWPIRSHRFMHHKLIYASYSTYIIRWNNKIVFPLLFKNFWYYQENMRWNSLLFMSLMAIHKR